MREKKSRKKKVQVGVAPPTRGVGRPSYKKTQLDHDIELVSKFHKDRIKRHVAMLCRESQTESR